MRPNRFIACLAGAGFLCTLALGPRAVHAETFPHPLFEKAQFALEAGDLDAAQKYLRKGLKKMPEHANAWVNLGNIHLMRDSSDAASEAFERALVVDPMHYMAMNGLGVAALQKGEAEPAIEWFLRSVEAEPTNVTPLVNLGDIGLMLGRPEFSIKYYALALEVEPSHAQAAWKLAQLHRMAGLPDQGLAYLRPALAAHPDDVDLLVEAGSTAMALENLPQALAHLTRAANLNDRRMDVLRTLALAAAQAREWAIAERAYRGALDLNDTLAGLHFEAGQMYYKMGIAGVSDQAFERGLRHLSAALTLEPDRADAKSQMADIFEEQGDVPAAVAAWEAAIADDSSYCPALNNLGRRKMVDGDVAGATVLFEKCLEVQPNFAMARLNRGLLYARTGKCGQARSELEPFTRSETDFASQISQALSACQ
jgi:tetratricopeptide (TPR) repeat protein